MTQIFMKNMQGVYKSQRRCIYRFKKKREEEEALKKMSDESNHIFQLIFVLYYIRDQSH